MAASVTHTFVSGVSDGADETLVRPSDWNAEHDVAITPQDINAAPNTVNYLVGTASADLTSEIEVGTTPGGELGGTWASPTVDTTHSGSSHSGVVTTHEAASDPHTGYVLESLFDAAGDLITASAADTPAKLAKGSTGDFLQAGASALSYVSVFIPVNFSKEGVVSTTTGTFRWYNRSGRTLTFHSASAAAAVGPNGSTMTIDVNVNDTTIMTGTKVVLPDTSGAASNVEQTTFSTTTITDDQYITVDIDTAGGGAVEDLVVSVWLKG